jgi:hypothetical protein
MSDRVLVASIPKCDLAFRAQHPERPAVYDAKTTFGPWGFLCQECFDRYGTGKLGTGLGQRLILACQVDGCWHEAHPDTDCMYVLGEGLGTDPNTIAYCGCKGDG